MSQDRATNLWSRHAHVSAADIESGSDDMLLTALLRSTGPGELSISGSGPLSQKGRQLQRILHDEATRSQAVEVIRSLIERIEIHWSGKHYKAKW